jgi:hypothetical protein
MAWPDNSEGSFHGWRWRLRAVAILMLAGLVSAPAVGEPAAARKTPPPALGSLTSTSGRFLAIGPDHRDNLELVDWAEDTLERLQRALGIKLMGGERRGVSIILHNVEPGGTADIQVEQSASAKGIQQTLSISNVNKMELDDVREALCRLLLDRHVLTLAREKPGEVRSVATSGAMSREWMARHSAPGWLAIGAGQILSAAGRARNGPSAVARLRRGAVEPIAIFLDRWKWMESLPLAATGATGRVPSREDRISAGLFTAWLLSQPEKGAVVEKVLQRAADGSGVTSEWLADALLEHGNMMALDETWDRWVIRQRRVVNTPGVAGPDDWVDMNLDLLLYAGDCGIPLAGEPFARLEWNDLVVGRDRPWIPAFARAKAVMLQVLGAGKGEKMGRTVAAYGEFLDGLARRRGERALRRALEKAEEQLRALEDGPAPSTAGAESPKPMDAGSSRRTGGEP